MMRLVRLVLMMFLVAGWAAAQCGGQATASGDKSKKDSPTAAEKKEMSCGCCKDMGKKDAEHKDAMKADHKDASKAGDKDAAKSEAKSEGGMGCCAKMGKDKDASGGGMKCGGGKKDDGSKSGTLPEQKMK